MHITVELSCVLLRNTDSFFKLLTLREITTSRALFCMQLTLVESRAPHMIPQALSRVTTA